MGRPAGSKNVPKERTCVDCGDTFMWGGPRLRCDDCHHVYKRDYSREQWRRAQDELRCIECGLVIPLPDGPASRRPKRCPTHAAAHEEARVHRKEELRRYRRHGIDEARYLEMLDAQGGRCAICRTDTPDAVGREWHIDHDHACCSGTFGCAKCVRALLCQSCNQGLGYFNDDPELVAAAIDYLERTSVGPKP